ncbi:fascin domain-containing protein [Dactylosporangium sp. CA-139066]|uniref:fascin domain-containing protein n=1 Tax=Dactylosporangium sp. CA-139066 TaxID=3239930 RepID=UPI003D8C9D28
MRRSLVVMAAAVVAAVVITPFAAARAGEFDVVHAVAGGGQPEPGHIDMTGATPAPVRDAALASSPTSVPGLFYCRKYRIWSYAAGRYVAEEQGFDGDQQNMLRARTPAAQVGSWEVFELCSADSGHTVYLTAPSGYLVTAEYNFTGNARGMLRGRGQWVDVWETFDVWTDNGRYYLRNPSKGTYFTCRVDYTGLSYRMMKATGTAAGSWEALRFDPV